MQLINSRTRGGAMGLHGGGEIARLKQNGSRWKHHAMEKRKSRNKEIIWCRYEEENNALFFKSSH
jgi:hypothetical protein